MADRGLPPNVLLDMCLGHRTLRFWPLARPRDGKATGALIISSVLHFHGTPTNPEIYVFDHKIQELRLDFEVPRYAGVRLAARQAPTLPRP